GPNPTIQLGGVAVARQGTGAVVYVRQDAGADHVFVSRLADGAFQAPERLDAGLSAAASQPVIAAMDDGRLAVAFVSGGAVVAVVKPAGDQPWTGPQVLAAAGSSPAVAASVNRGAYVAFTTPGGGGADVRLARLDRRSAAFTVYDGPLDVDPNAAAGDGAGRPSVGIAADNSAVVAWGEGGHVYARRAFADHLSQYSQDAGVGDAPEVALEDDSGLGWAMFRSGATVVARRLRGATFDGPVVLGPGEAVGAPRLALAPRGVGYAAVGGAATNGAFASVLVQDAFRPFAALGGGFAAGPAPVPAVDDDGDGVVAFQQGDAAGGRAIGARRFPHPSGGASVPAPGRAVTLSRPELGPPDAALGLDAASDRLGDTAIAWVQADASGRRLVAGAFDRAPGAFAGTTTTAWRRDRRVLAWSESRELWGPLTYVVSVDRRAVGQVAGRTRIRLARPLRRGEHRWRVAAVDRRGQVTRTRARTLRIGPAPRKGR
ncbi:MAG TPA: hypothetical protein VLA98_09735, partial [Solirubrobacteraceae bacterium]|nr:hypothetical protein [Solirubrobacteraceae bacterium]